jgi:hypothetical protein
VFHGHAHHGRLEGRTHANTPVYNVSWTMMRERNPDRPFRIVEIPAAGPARPADGPAASERLAPSVVTRA